MSDMLAYILLFTGVGAFFIFTAGGNGGRPRSRADTF